MDEKSVFFLAVFTFIAGSYLGSFLSEASTMFQCERDQQFVVAGTFWKGEIKYLCNRKD